MVIEKSIAVLGGVIGCAVLFACGTPAPEDGRTQAGIYFESVGKGPTVVLIHGFSLDRRMWDDQWSILRDSYHVIRYDLRGHGASARADSSYRPHVDFLGVLDTLRVESAVLVGLSAGGELAIDFALTYPSRVRALFLVSPGLSGYVPQGSFAWMNPVGEALRVGDHLLATERWMDTPLMAVENARGDSMMRVIVRDNAGIWSYRSDTRVPFDPPAINRLAQLTVPTTVVIGAEDLEDTHSVATLIATTVPNATSRTVRGVGHLVNLGAPEEFNEILLDFLRRLPDVP